MVRNSKNFFKDDTFFSDLEEKNPQNFLKKFKTSVYSVIVACISTNKLFSKGKRTGPVGVSYTLKTWSSIDPINIFPLFILLNEWNFWLWALLHSWSNKKLNIVNPSNFFFGILGCFGNTVELGNKELFGYHKMVHYCQFVPYLTDPFNCSLKPSLTYYKSQ